MSKILLVEDDLNIATIYKIKLEHSGYTFKHGENGLEALKLLEDFVPDLVLLDLMMPVMDGETFLKILRKNLKYTNLPVIVLTNINRSEAPKTLWHYGIEDYIVKAHTTPTEIVQAIAKTLLNIPSKNNRSV